MALRDTASLVLASAPFTDIEVQTLSEHRNHTGFRSDCNYFAEHRKMRFAIRRALSELDWLADLGACPPPPLYVFVTKIDDGAHTVEGMFRGVPHWKQTYRRGYVYADVQTNQQAFELMLACRDSGGMNDAARSQFEMHRRYVSLMRAFNATIALHDGKVVN